VRTFRKTIDEIRERETGFPHFERHATRGSREIFQWTYGPDGGRCPEYPSPHIAGAQWECGAQRDAFYRRQREDGYPWFDGHLTAMYDGFLGYCAFDTWTEAEAWLFGDAR
jgi:hypothetical protein